MFLLLTLIHIVVCVFLIIVVLLQSGKAADLAGAFGGMGSQTAFGPRGSATLLTKATTVSAVVFMLTSLTLSVMATRHSGTGNTVLEKSQQSAPAKGAQTPPAQAPAPLTPVTPAAPGTAPAPGQPSITLTPEGGGPSRTIPLNIPPPPGQKPAQQQQQQPAPAKK